ncbi:serine/threonine-protein phosphatase [Streptomyces sp. NA02950]|uniref:PP2C family protein-serine/threonine phosphatase n=1 Tax=Streptomyces sp. NA02950 TaxID=2742137 RepID=UPI00159220E4|nr:PP2C family protein-serine/threonine phosphatase [Streptomyces sp. NA02950]QKV97035.1 serine/threonine-protein phosphatase [Streptomyces sp. NA02950]
MSTSCGHSCGTGAATKRSHPSLWRHEDPNSSSLTLDNVIGNPPAKVESYLLAPGDRLLLHTNGVIEARNPDGVFFALAEAMEAVSTCTPSQFLEQLHRALIRHTGGHLADDAAMIVVDRLDEEAGEPVARAAVARHLEA